MAGFNYFAHQGRRRTTSSDYPCFHHHLVLGKFIDYRNFSEARIQKWVVNQWIKFGEIKVQKFDCFFLFLCEDVRDRDALLQQSSAAYQGALLIFKPWNQGESIRDIKFDKAAIWVHLDEVPLDLCDINIVNPMLNLVGNFLSVDEPLPGSIRCLVRVKIQVHVLEPLFSGFYLNLGHSEFKWINFRYENLFILCSKCNKIGHKQNSCSLNSCMTAPCLVDGRGLSRSASLPAHNLSNMNIGLKRTEKFRTTTVNLRSLFKGINPYQPQNIKSNKRPPEFVTPSLSPLKKRKFQSEPRTQINLVPNDPSQTQTQPTFSFHKISLCVPKKKQHCHGSFPIPLSKPSPSTPSPRSSRLHQRFHPLKRPKPPFLKMACNKDIGWNWAKEIFPSNRRASVSDTTAPPAINSTRCFSCFTPSKKRKRLRGVVVTCKTFSTTISSGSSGCLQCLLPFKKRKGQEGSVSTSTISVAGLVAPLEPPRSR